MPRQRKRRTVEDIDREIERAYGKLDHLQEERKKVIAEEDAVLGEMLRKIFKDLLPDGQMERRSFLLKLKDLYEGSQQVATEQIADAAEPSSTTEVHSMPSNTVASNAVPGTVAMGER